MKHTISGRTKYSFYYSLSVTALSLVNGFFGIVVTSLLIGCFSFVFNDLKLTANQIINVPLLMEMGFTLASNVAVFAPLSKAKSFQYNYTIAIGDSFFI